MTLKIELAKGNFSGNLKEMQQHYKINYLPQVKEENVIKYLDKIEFALITPAKDSNDTSYHSLRFVDPEQVKMLIFDLILAYAYFKKQKGELNEFTLGSFPYLLEKQIKKIFKDVYEGIHDQT